MTNKEIWKLWVDEYNELNIDDPRGYNSPKEIEETFYKPYPENYRSLIDALISCIKWHPSNRKTLKRAKTNFYYGFDNSENASTLCGHCYGTFVYNENFFFDSEICKEHCKLYKKLGESCTMCNSLYTKANDELVDQLTNDPKPVNCNKLYKILLSIYREEYEKLFGKDWKDKE